MLIRLGYTRSGKQIKEKVCIGKYWMFYKGGGVSTEKGGLLLLQQAALYSLFQADYNKCSTMQWIVLH